MVSEEIASGLCNLQHAPIRAYPAQYQRPHARTGSFPSWTALVVGHPGCKGGAEAKKTPFSPGWMCIPQTTLLTSVLDDLKRGCPIKPWQDPTKVSTSAEGSRGSTGRYQEGQSLVSRNGTSLYPGARSCRRCHCVTAGQLCEQRHMRGQSVTLSSTCEIL